VATPRKRGLSALLSGGSIEDAAFLRWLWDRPLQRLFSTFPDGWPGAGLLLLRIGAAIPLIYFGFSGTAVSLVAAAGGLLLLLGLWTPVAGIAVAIDELWIAFSSPVVQPSDRWLHILLAILAAAIAMLGPGAWSVDARLFGRQRFEIDGRNRRE
jgi:putative oxidoreductase